MKGHRIWAEINLRALRHNISVVRRAIGPHPKIMAVVKADAYGHGAIPVAWTAREAGCSVLGVGDSGEAIRLRECGLPGSLLILGAIIEEEIPEVVRHDISVTVHSTDLLPALNHEARRLGRFLRVHLKVDTGMGRLGVSPGNTLHVARAITAMSNLKLEGLSTHLASGADAGVSRGQLDLFKSAADELARNGIRPPLLHAANSPAVFTCPEAHLDMVRPGIALYGMDPGIFERLGLPLQPVLSLKTRIAYLKRSAQDVPLGYGGQYRTPRPTLIATCPAGYNDGYPYQLSHRAEVILRGRRVPVVGTVTMDYIMLDVGSVPEADVGDEVTLIGDGIRVEELARRIGTIPYELTCRLGRRVKRIPVNAELAPPALYRDVA